MNWDNTDKGVGDREIQRKIIGGWGVGGVFGDSWETAHSSFLQNTKWAQHNILKTDKIPSILHALYLSFKCLLIH